MTARALLQECRYPLQVRVTLFSGRSIAIRITMSSCASVKLITGDLPNTGDNLNWHAVHIATVKLPKGNLQPNCSPRVL